MMKALAAGRAAQAKIAVPDFGAERADDDTDFNDMVGLRGRGAVKQAFTDAVEPQALFERRLLNQLRHSAKRISPNWRHGCSMIAPIMKTS